MSAIVQTIKITSVLEEFDLGNKEEATQYQKLVVIEMIRVIFYILKYNNAYSVKYENTHLDLC